MATARIEIKAEEVGAQLTARYKGTIQWIDQAQFDAANFAMRKAVKGSPVDQGFYKNAWKVTRRSLLGKTQTELRNDAPYAGVLESGTRPYWPPFAPLFEWAKRKAGDLALGGMVSVGSQAFTKTKAGTLRYKGQASLEEDDLGGLHAFVRAIQRKVAREGFKPKHILRQTLGPSTRYLKQKYDERVRQNLGRKL